MDFSGCSLLTDFLGPRRHADKRLTGSVVLNLGRPSHDKKVTPVAI